MANRADPGGHHFVGYSYLYSYIALGCSGKHPVNLPFLVPTIMRQLTYLS